MKKKRDNKLQVKKNRKSNIKRKRTNFEILNSNKHILRQREMLKTFT